MEKTIKDRCSAKSSVVQSNELAQGFAKLKLSSTRLFAALLSMIDSKGQVNNEEVFIISVNKYAELYGRKGKEGRWVAYKEMISGAKHLFKNDTVNIKKDADSDDHFIHIFEECVYKKNEAEVHFKWSKKILPYISQIEKNFSKYTISNLGLMNSKYGPKLYAIIQGQWHDKRTQEFTWSIEKIKHKLAIPPKSYCNWKDLKKRAIDPAINDINMSLDIFADYKVIKRGRNTTGVKFIFAKKGNLNSDEITSILDETRECLS